MLSETCGHLVVFSHLRWDWVWQRPQHLISRLAAGIPTTFVEEPTATGANRVKRGRRLDVRERSASFRTVSLRVPGPQRWVGFGDPSAASYADELAELLDAGQQRAVWLYTAMALPLLDTIGGDVVVYDVMDDLSAFAGAAREQTLRHRAAIRRADVIFTGGRSLHAGVATIRPDGVHCFPSGVDPEHFHRERAERPPSRRPVAGYVGVIDERVDADLIAALASELPDWDIDLVGPVAKIDPNSLPQAPNIAYLGPRRYEELPDVLASFDVALMPFALNDATRSISPTKTLEYLAAGLPVVSTRVPDVVADVGHVVRLADDGPAFAEACRDAVAAPRRRSKAVQKLLDARRWDTIAQSMATLVRNAHLGQPLRSAAGSGASRPA